MNNSETVSNRSFSVRKMTFIALFGALAAVLMSFNFKLPFMPPFLKFDVSDVPGLFAAFYFGPLSGAVVTVIKVLLELLLTGTETAFVGEVSNLVMSLALILPAGFIYKKNKTKRNALLSLIGASIVACGISIVVNKFIMLPLYAELYKMPMEKIIGLCSSVMPLIKDEFGLLAFGILPFNIVKCFAVSVVTFLIYKRLGSLLSKILNPKK